MAPAAGSAEPSPTARFTCERMQGRDVAPEASLGVLRTLGLVFVAAIGGAYGLEGCIQSGGGLWTLAGVAALPWVWGFPAALVIAELATSIPANSGVDSWISCVFPTWYTVVSILWTFWCNRLDNATYPNLFMDYISESYDFATWQTVLIRVGFVALCTVPNILGIEIVGVASVVMMVVTVLPFLLLFALEWGLHGIRTDDLWTTPDKGVDWTTFLPTLLWNISGFDSVGHVAEEIQSTPHTLVGALMGVLFLTQICYGLPVIAGISAQSRRAALNGTISPTDFSEWDDGHFVALARWVDGEWLATCITLGAATSAFGFMVSLLCTTSRALQGHAMLGLFPPKVNEFLRRLHPTYKTPVNAIVINALMCAGTCLAADFETLLSISSVFYSIRLLSVLVACPLLRVQHPTLARPFAIPLGTRGLCAMLVIPIVTCAGSSVFAVQQNMTVGVATGAITVGSIIMGTLLARYYFPDGLDSRITYEYESIDTATPRYGKAPFAEYGAVVDADVDPAASAGNSPVSTGSPRISRPAPVVSDGAGV